MSTPYALSSALSACINIELFDRWENSFIGLFSSGDFLLKHMRAASCKLLSAVFYKMQLRDGVSYNSLISGLAQSGYSDTALELFEKMQLDCLKPDCVTVASLLIACTSAGALHKEEQLHSYTIKVEMSKGIIIEGSLLVLYVVGLWTVRKPILVYPDI
ncbi:hypothetical protein ACOSQ2_014706 [Xanthoceras sorbifolium]